MSNTFQVGDKVRLKKRPYITGTVVSTSKSAAEVKYDGDLIPPVDYHFNDDLEYDDLFAREGALVEELFSRPHMNKSLDKKCECGIHSLYGKDSGYAHSDYCPLYKKEPLNG